MLLPYRLVPLAMHGMVVVGMETVGVEAVGIAAGVTGWLSVSLSEDMDTIIIMFVALVILSAIDMVDTAGDIAINQCNDDYNRNSDYCSVF